MKKNTRHTNIVIMYLIPIPMQKAHYAFIHIINDIVIMYLKHKP